MHNDENLVERDEVLLSNTSIIDKEPFYKNFTTIQNNLRYSNQQKQNKHLPRIINGYIFNLIQIVEDIGYQMKSPLIPSIRNDDKKNSALIHLVLKLGGAYGPLVNRRRSNVDKEYFQRWYLTKYRCSASLLRNNLLIKKTTQILDDYQSNKNLRQSIITNLSLKHMDDTRFQNKVLRMYGFDDTETNSSITSSRRSSIDELNSTPTPQSLPTKLETINNKKNSQPKQQQITIREYYPNKDTVNRSASPSSTSSQQTIQDIGYEQLIHNHPNVYNDPNPEIITRSNPDQITYQQNVSVRYLVPPTPPPPGPLIIREILPPRQPTPPPLVIKQQNPRPSTPPPLILREAPPVPPAHQPAQVITKVLPQESPPTQRVIYEHQPSLPPKPQSIIIEKWLPYKPAPPREVIYERIVEPPVVSQFQPDRQRRHSAEMLSQSYTQIPIPVHIERQNSFDHLDTKHTSVFDQFAWSTQKHLERMQAHQQWIANQHQKHMNMLQHMIPPLTTPALIVNHPPVTRTATSYVQREELLYQPVYMYPTYT